MLTLLKIKKDIAHRIMQGLMLWDNFLVHHENVSPPKVLSDWFNTELKVQ